jgi:hypothetical protein
MVLTFFIWFAVFIQPFLYLKNFEKYEQIDSFQSMPIYFQIHQKIELWKVK